MGNSDCYKDGIASQVAVNLELGTGDCHEQAEDIAQILKPFSAD
jgi:hypothetical protein